MKTQWKAAVLAAMALGVTAIVLGASMGTAGQAGRSVQAGAVPRTADGKPDFSGIWQVMSTANWNILPHAASKDGPAGMGVVEGGELPYQPSALQKRDANYKNRLTADTDARCFLPGVPRIMYEPFPFQISQTPAAVMMFFEYQHALRNVYMNTAHPPGPIEWWMGDSRGTWDGDTLVVDVIHFNDETCGRTLHLPGCRPPQLRSHDRGPEGVHAPVEDEHGFLQAQGAECPASGV
jgi:hypothetical protein